MHFGAPALALAVAQVHARQVAGEQRRFVAAGAGADFEEGVARRRPGRAAAARPAARPAAVPCRRRPRRFLRRAISAISGSASIVARRLPGRARAAGTGGTCCDHLRHLGLLARQTAVALDVGQRPAGRTGWRRARPDAGPGVRTVRAGSGSCVSGWMERGRRRTRARRRRRRASGSGPLTAARRRARASSGAGTAATPCRASCSRSAPSAACNSARAPCSIFCVRPRDSASST